MKVYLDNCSYNRPFDYTKWQSKYYAALSVNELNKKAVEYAKMIPVRHSGDAGAVDTGINEKMKKSI